MHVSGGGRPRPIASVPVGAGVQPANGARRTPRQHCSRLAGHCCCVCCHHHVITEPGGHVVLILCGSPFLWPEAERRPTRVGVALPPLRLRLRPRLSLTASAATAHCYGIM